MALYPQTTCFYKAVVNIPPQTHKDEYEVLFEDPTYPEGRRKCAYVSWRDFIRAVYLSVHFLKGLLINYRFQSIIESAPTLCDCIQR